MTNAVVTQLEVAAVPVAIAIVEAAQQFIVNLGTDPLQFAAKFPGASQVFLGTVEMSLPALAVSEIAAAQTALNTAMAGWITKLKALTPAPAATP